MKKIKALLAILVLTFSLGLAFAIPAQAQFKSNPLDQFAKESFKDTFETENVDLESSLPKAVGNIINIALGFTGVIMLVILVYAGFLWMTDPGNEQQVGKAKTLIRNVVIGMAITLSAFVITNFVVDQLDKALRSSSTPAQPSDGAPTGGG